MKKGGGGGAPTAGVTPLHPVHLSNRIAVDNTDINHLKRLG